jgi:hypothetical protein
MPRRWQNSIQVSSTLDAERGTDGSYVSMEMQSGMIRWINLRRVVSVFSMYNFTVTMRERG